MDKNTPHYDLAEVKRLIQEGKAHVTKNALRGAWALGLEFGDVLDTALNLERSDFYKSMTTYREHRVWQDVYRPQTLAGAVYFKLTVTHQAVIISFKEL
ncbi:MAG: type II toxin-antitoxin system MqsR family toxin [Deltaproteobacteria bacterium]|nr:type II toxin-antitoxin system MqsR family toxin [Deltaproteobacteria bacterium]